MPRAIRKCPGGFVYHVLNRSNGRLRIFKKSEDFAAFERILAEGIERFNMRLTGYCLMSNHWHLLLWPRGDQEISAFMQWITMTHSHRWHAAHRTTGIGHLYQGRFKSFPVQSGRHYLTALWYVEQIPLRAGIVQSSVDWPWSSLAIRAGEDKPIKLSPGSITLPRRWQHWVDGFDETAAKEVETCVHRGRPLGSEKWIMKAAKEMSLESSLRPLGRPKSEAK